MGENIVSPVFNDVTIDQVDAPFVYTSDFSLFAMGNYSSYVADPSVDGYYTYYLGADNKLRYSDSPITLHNFRFVFIFFANDTDPAPEVSINIDDDGLVEVNSARKANDPKGTYNLQGVKVNKPMQKGIYIENGRKVVIK